MENNFLGKWIGKDKTIEITKRNKIFECTFKRNNLGIIFKNSLIFSEFDDDVESGGVGVYSPVGDGSAYFALWSSTRINGLLGSGIALKSDESDDLIGEYTVRYFVGKNEVNSFLVKIECADNKEVYKLAWHKDGQKIFHGIGIMMGESLAIAWGSINCRFDLDICSFADNFNSLEMQTIRWDDNKINNCALERI